MTEPPESAWLFTRGSQSVRLVRYEQSGGHVRLLVYGPADTESSYEFGDIAECMKRQTDIEQTLLAEGYQLAARAAERRGTRRVWFGPDRRRSSALDVSAPNPGRLQSPAFEDADRSQQHNDNKRDGPPDHRR
jgi:hypothetical protein